MRGLPLALVIVAAGATPCAAANDAACNRCAALEQRLTSEPENLAIAAEYRQLAIEANDVNRPIRFFERLAKRSPGPNVYISLALAYVDKVPTSGDLRRLYLGRDAMAAATKSIERRPSVLAYYIRGLVNLYYNNFIFKRIPHGLADLQQALALVTSETPAALAARVYVSLGDGHWRIDERPKAREWWRRGLERYPADEVLKARLSADNEAVRRQVTEALYAGTRVDTSLRELRP